ncbi:MAG: hypothetical protein KatS3mg092_0211 [Patescibacteria group bacterium]|nr:MAG: hypothetical protein KatS3mg092_0211 [Patescibacteria group bacterium]
MLNSSFLTQIIFDLFFKIALIILAIIYLLYALAVSKNIKIMVKTLDDKFNYLIIFISSLQITAGLILLIFAIFLI